LSYYPKTAILPHVLFIDGWSAESSDITFKRMIQAKFGLNWPSGFRGEDFFKSLQTDDRHQIFKILILFVLYFKNYKR
jgi:hypothetical protein